MKFHFFKVFLLTEGGPFKGNKVVGKVRLRAPSAQEARRRIIGFVAHQSKPDVPEGATPAEREHIENQWNRMRVLTIDAIPAEDLKALDVPDSRDVFWWDWDELPPDPQPEAETEEA